MIGRSIAQKRTNVRRLFPVAADFENLSRLRTEVSADANTFDYSRVIVNKPWGYEYLWYQNTSVAVWMLHLASGRATSLHCHARKRTSLIVLSGRVECTTFEERFALSVGDAIVFEPCVFHATRACSPEGACVLEVETPPLKGDLLRYRDDFGRVGKGYETSQQYSTDVANFDYAPFTAMQRHNETIPFKGLQMRYCMLQRDCDLSEQLTPGGIAIPFLGRLVFGRDVVADVGEAISVENIPQSGCPAIFPPVEVLQLAVA